MKKKSKNTEKISNGFNGLINTYIAALEENSEDIASMLEKLKGRKLSEANKDFLKDFKKQLKRIDGNLKKLGD